MNVLKSDIKPAVLDRIKVMMDSRGWTTYRLAEVAGVQHSIIYNMFKRKTLPRIDTLEKICNGFGITLYDFFIFTVDTEDGGHLSKEEQRLIEISRCLKKERSIRLNYYAEGMLDSQKYDN